MLTGRRRVALGGEPAGLVLAGAVQRGETLRAADAVAGLRLEHPFRRQAEVMVVLQGLPDEFPQNGILEQLPPAEFAEGVSGGAARAGLPGEVAMGRRSVHLRAAIVRTDGATGQDGQRDEQKQVSAAHCRPPSADCAAGVAAGGAARRGLNLSARPWTST